MLLKTKDEENCQKRPSVSRQCLSLYSRSDAVAVTGFEVGGVWSSGAFPRPNNELQLAITDFLQKSGGRVVHIRYR